ncbi:type I DNA topoisomerase [bacterium]|nr:type I DNA topoisomerase [bacterium]
MEKKSLVIVESPAKCKTLSKFLDSSFKIMASKGHIRDLPEGEFGVNIKDNFQPRYTVIKGKKSIVDTLKRASKSSDRIYLALDPDREGEAIAWHITKVIDTDSKELFRVLFNEITKKAVLGGIMNPTQIDSRKVYAQQARRILDRLVGYLVSPILWKTYYSGLSAGRVQSVALRLLCEKQADIDKFKPEEYWRIFLNVVDGKDKDNIIRTRLTRFKNEIVKIPNQEEVDRIYNEIKNIKQFIVKSVEKKPKFRKAPPPYITSTLQHDAVKFMKFSTVKTMKVAQSLYEGIDLGKEGPMGLITYMRTDSTRIADEALKQAKEFILDKYGNNYLTPKEYHPSKGAQDAHEAIRPTSVVHTPDKIKEYLNKDQYKLYRLIWRRFLASQMKPAKYEVTDIKIEGNEYLFEVQNSQLIFDGFLVLTTEDKEEKEDTVLPALKEGQEVRSVGIEKEQNFTKPPSQFTEGTIVKELEANGIGRPSTYSQIISTLLARNYVKRESGKLKPTQIGLEINNLLVKLFPDIFNVTFTAQLEEKLDEVESGKRNWVNLLKKFYTSFKPALESVREKQQELKKQTETVTKYKCEECGADMVVKWGKYGRFLACSAFPDCQNAKPLPPELGGKKDTNDVQGKCPKCGSKLVVKYSKQNRRFVACEAYPKCRYTESYKTGLKCPKPNCDGNLVERYTKKGRQFYGCDKYPQCDFASWDEPINEKCPECQTDTIFKKDTSNKLKLYCVNCSWSEEHSKSS